MPSSGYRGGEYCVATVVVGLVPLGIENEFASTFAAKLGTSFVAATMGQLVLLVHSGLGATIIPLELAVAVGTYKGTLWTNLEEVRPLRIVGLGPRSCNIARIGCCELLQKHLLWVCPNGEKVVVGTVVELSIRVWL